MGHLRLDGIRAPVLFGIGFLAFGCAVVANAIVMQPSRHPAPLFAPPTRASVRPTPPLPPERPAIQVSTKPAVEPDAIAERETIDRLSTGKLAARTTETGAISAMPPRAPDRPVQTDKGLVPVQQALIKGGYGPTKADGVLGPETRAAIERFERERRLPVTGGLSPKLMRELGLSQPPRT